MSQPEIRSIHASHITAPIGSLSVMRKVIERIHIDGYTLCKRAFGSYFPNAGNIGIFCQNNAEYKRALELRDRLVFPSPNPTQKYYTLRRPFIIPAVADVPQTVYSYLYIRTPDPTPYGRYRGDIDFYVSDREYRALEERLEGGEKIPGAILYDHPTQRMIELSDPAIPSLAYISTREMTERVRLRES